MDHHFLQAAMLFLMVTMAHCAVKFTDIQESYFEEQRNRERLSNGGESSYRGNNNGNNNINGEGDSGNSNGNCYGNCADNNAGNHNGNNNINSRDTGNKNGNCFGNCVGNHLGNNNGNNNADSRNIGNNNGNCVGNCFHNNLGNNNGNHNSDTQDRGNNLGNCRGNCFHLNLGNNQDNGQISKDDSKNQQYSFRTNSPTKFSCYGNCFPSKQPGNPQITKTPREEVAHSPMTCLGKDGFRYYIGPQTYCVELWRSGLYTSPSRTYCGKGQAFDLDICACNHWLLVGVEGSCRSGTGQNTE